MKALIIVIDAVNQASENDWVKVNVDKVGGEDTFTVPLTADKVNISNYWCCWMATDDDAELLDDHFGDLAFDGAIESPDSILEKLGLFEMDDEEL